MPDLEDKIVEWRRQMLAAGIKTPVPLDELESHLRDEVEQQMKSGLSAPPAFEAAIQRLGQARALKMEFKKVGATEGKQMKRIVVILAALFGMVLGLSMVLPQLGQWSRTGVMHSLGFLLLGAALVIVGGSAAFHGIRTHREARGRKLVSIGLIAACGFYAMPFVVAFFQPQQTDLMGWMFCGGLTAMAVLFFGTCLYFNRHAPTGTARES
jgi:cation transport ATPase